LLLQAFAQGLYEYMKERLGVTADLPGSSSSSSKVTADADDEAEDADATDKSEL
jgi:hypothetical protein